MVFGWLSGVAAPLGAVEAKYYTTLYEMCDALLATQITSADSPDCGALVCPSVNPQKHPLHSRAGEAVYPLAVAYGETGQAKYRDAAILLGNWMIRKQQPRGAWGEDWPNYDGWAGTTSDQLISLAGALEMLRADMPATDRANWEQSISRAADFIVRTFPAGNINYQPTGAVALCLAGRVVAKPPAAWSAKAQSLMKLTMAAVNSDGFIVGEGNGVDLGYNIAQSIGYIALYGELTGDQALRHRAADLLRTHLFFVYPNGTVDNSWGTRSFKWVYESGTKTAPGVYFTFALLEDLDVRFTTAGRLCLDYLADRAMLDGLVGYGPHAARHESTEPPCLYSTFVRAQSLALAIHYRTARDRAATPEPIPAQQPNWFHYFPTVKVAVVRTPSMMATISAYGEVSRYGRGQVSRGGSITNLWIDGFGRDGLAQSSSVTDYKREEPAHMPIESNLLPLTPRIEATVNGVRYTNLYESDGTLETAQRSDHVEVSARGHLRAADGATSQIEYRITQRFYADRLAKEFAIRAPRGMTITVTEPFVKHVGMRVTEKNPRQIEVSPVPEHRWILEMAGDAPIAHFTIGTDEAKYWCPFPSVECTPIIATFVTAASESKLSLLLRPE